jgi:spore maturation protein CgeB
MRQTSIFVCNFRCKSMANILYLGDGSPGSTSGHRASALSRLGHHTVVADPYKTFKKQLQSRWFGPIHFRTGYRFLNNAVVRWLKETIDKQTKPDIVWVNSGELFGPDSLKVLTGLSCPIVLYNNDDPTGGRDGRRFNSLISALPYYNLCAVMREINVNEFKDKGAKRVIRVFMSYDEEVHKPFANRDEIPDQFRSDVAFIGTWMRYEKRDEFLMTLIQQGINVSIWGDRWDKSPHFETIKPFWRGAALRGRDYVAAMQGAKICLGLLSKGNRDLHTQRTLETPYAGGLFCAERTSEHMQLYKEGVEAVFWSDADECARVCKQLLADDVLRENIRAAGMQRVRANRVGNEDACRTILNALAAEKVLTSYPE